MRALILTLALLVGCPAPGPEPYTPPPPLIFDGGDVASACSALRFVGCPEGDGSRSAPCETVLARAVELRPLPLACWARAEDAAQARACGQLRCIR